ncbi:hypothetical protein [Paludibacterium purpuratum]|uniref:Uncharacterized protein n=1 Tax=Paludibacterium purpuratum TaxID=1144873 RepID=A0A4R7BB39_9NEIS|nr:hypothetical protein [Paludibacterium purpuratum]TDR82190.1 hypothetical protein DFP86_102304 [Paludibacterium purpuratum]
MIKVQKFQEQTSPAFANLTPMDLKAQSAMVMAKINRLPFEERAVLWCLHVQRETEIIFLADRTPRRWSMATDKDIIRKWCTGDGPGCRDIGDRHDVSFKTANRYEKEVVRMLECWMHKAYATLEIQHRAILQHLYYAERLTA